MRVLVVCLVLAAAIHASCAENVFADAAGMVKDAFEKVTHSDNIVSEAVEKVKDTVDKIIHRGDQNNKGISNKLYVKYAPWILDPLRTNSYFALPRTLNGLADTKNEVWRITEDALKTEGVSVACRNNDYRVCLLVDQKNSTAGLRISVAVADMQKSNNAPVSSPQRKNTMFGTEVYSTSIYFVEQDVLKAGGRDMTEETLTAPNGFFFDTGDKGLRHIPVEEKDIKAPYIKQNCFGGMGRHYFWDINPSLSNCDHLDGYFALYNEKSHQLAGCGFLSYGKNRLDVNGRAWFEFLPSFAIKQIAPSSPPCAAEYINKYGTNVMHIWVVDKPWRLGC